MSNFKIYTLNHPVTNEIKYVGYTSTSLEERLRCHLKDVNSKCVNSYKNKWIRSLFSDGLKPVIVFMESFEKKKDVISREIELIAEYRRLGLKITNNTDGGEGGTGYKFTKEKRAEISLKLKGKKFKPCSEERKKKMSVILSGRKMTEEQKDKMRGRIVSKETRKKLSDVGKGRKLSSETKDKMSKRMRVDWAEGKMKPSRLGMKNSESHKDKMRGSNNPFYGKTHSPEMRKLISERVRLAIKKKKDEQLE